MSQAASPKPEPTIDPLLTRVEVCQILRIKETKLWELTSRGELPPVRIGGHVRYRRQDVERYIDAQREPGKNG